MWSLLEAFVLYFLVAKKKFGSIKERKKKKFLFLLGQISFSGVEKLLSSLQ